MQDINIINKNSLIIFVILIPIIVVGLSTYNVTRNGNAIDNFNPFSSFGKFFIDQGGSVDIISYAQKYKGQLPNTNVNYTFGPFINYAKRGTIAKILRGDKNETDLSKEDVALYGNNLGATISYLAMKNRYLRGEGLGTEYIAELYIDYSYYGVIIYNFILGMLLTIIMKINYQNYIFMPFVMNLVESIIYLPRQFATAWIVNIMNVSNIVLILFILVSAYCICGFREKGETKKRLNNAEE